MERYGLFKRLADGSPYWVDAANDFEEGKKKIEHYSKTNGGGEYFVHDLRYGTTVASIGAAKTEVDSPYASGNDQVRPGSSRSNCLGEQQGKRGAG